MENLAGISEITHLKQRVLVSIFLLQG